MFSLYLMNYLNINLMGKEQIILFHILQVRNNIKLLFIFIIMIQVIIMVMPLLKISIFQILKKKTKILIII